MKNRQFFKVQSLGIMLAMTALLGTACAIRTQPKRKAQNIGLVTTTTGYLSLTNKNSLKSSTLETTTTTVKYLSNQDNSKKAVYVDSNPRTTVIATNDITQKLEKLQENSQITERKTTITKIDNIIEINIDQESNISSIVSKFTTMGNKHATRTNTDTIIENTRKTTTNIITEIETQVATETETQAATEKETKATTKTETRATTKTETRATTKTETRATTKTETRATTKTETRATTKTETRATTKTETQATTKTETRATTKTETQATTKTETQATTEIETQVTTIIITDEINLESDNEDSDQVYNIYGKPVDKDNCLVLNGEYIEIVYGSADRDSNNVDKYDVVQDTESWSDDRNKYLFGHSVGSLIRLSRTEVGNEIILINNGVVNKYVTVRSECGHRTQSNTDIESDIDGTYLISSDFGFETIRIITCYGWEKDAHWVVIGRRVE